MKRGIPLAAVLDLALSGCATLISGRTQIITVDLVNANGATCRGVDQVGQKYVWEKTPSSTEVIKGDGPLILTCEREGFKKTVYNVKERFAAANAASLIFPPAILIDAITGAAQEYPSIIKFAMEPADNAPEAEKRRYREGKKRIEEERIKAEKEDQEQIRKAGGG